MKKVLSYTVIIIFRHLLSLLVNILKLKQICSDFVQTNSDFVCFRHMFLFKYSGLQDIKFVVFVCLKK